MPNRISPDSIRAAYLMRNDCERCANAHRCDGVNPCEFREKRDKGDDDHA